MNEPALRHGADSSAFRVQTEPFRTLLSCPDAVQGAAAVRGRLPHDHLHRHTAPATGTLAGTGGDRYFRRPPALYSRACRSGRCAPLDARASRVATDRVPDVSAHGAVCLPWIHQIRGQPATDRGPAFLSQLRRSDHTVDDAHYDHSCGQSVPADDRYGTRSTRSGLRYDPVGDPVQLAHSHVPGRRPAVGLLLSTVPAEYAGTAIPAERPQPDT